MSLALLTLTAFLIASPKLDSVKPYFSSYNGQIQGLKDTTILIEVRYYLDEARIKPLSKQFRNWVDIDSMGMFLLEDLEFYYKPLGNEFFWYESRLLGMRTLGKSQFALGCGNLNQKQEYYDKKREAEGE